MFCCKWNRNKKRKSKRHTLRLRHSGNLLNIYLLRWHSVTRPGRLKPLVFPLSDALCAHSSMLEHFKKKQKKNTPLWVQISKSVRREAGVRDASPGPVPPLPSPPWLHRSTRMSQPNSNVSTTSAAFSPSVERLWGFVCRLMFAASLNSQQ